MAHLGHAFPIPLLKSIPNSSLGFLEMKFSGLLGAAIKSAYISLVQRLPKTKPR